MSTRRGRKNTSSQDFDPTPSLGKTIQRLRKEAESALGRKFDIRAFHDQVLGSGALPMKVLEGKVRGWIARTRAAR